MVPQDVCSMEKDHWDFQGRHTHTLSPLSHGLQPSLCHKALQWVLWQNGSSKKLPQIFSQGSSGVFFMHICDSPVHAGKAQNGAYNIRDVYPYGSRSTLSSFSMTSCIQNTWELMHISAVQFWHISWTFRWRDYQLPTWEKFGQVFRLPIRSRVLLASLGLWLSACFEQPLLPFPASRERQQSWSNLFLL